jgi:alpha-glucosidase (family GH31 glycosyl hydrolase)
VSPDGLNFLELRDRELLIRDAMGEPVIRRWWNGYSAVPDLTNPGDDRLDLLRAAHLQDDFGLDGFNFDGGDVEMCCADDVTFAATTPTDQVHRYGLSLQNSTSTSCAPDGTSVGSGFASRVSDANHSWDENTASAS